MEKIVSAIVEFFSNKSLHIGFKLSISFFIFLVLVLLNDFLGISRNYILNARLEQIIELKQVDPYILKDDTTVNKMYLQIKSAIINDESKTEELIKYGK